MSKTLKPTKCLSLEEQMHTHNEVIYSYQNKLITEMYMLKINLKN